MGHDRHDPGHDEKNDTVLNKINLNIDQNLSLQEYSMEFKSKSGKVLETIQKMESLHKIAEDKKEHNPKEAKKIKKFKKKKFKKKNFKKKN